MNTTNKFIKGDIVAFNFTKVKTPMRIKNITKSRLAHLEHRDLKYDCGYISTEYLEAYNDEYDHSSAYDANGNLLHCSRK